MMKHFPKTLIVALLLLAATAGAQNLSDYEEVVYLKNGSIYRGLIIEQIPGESLKIEIMGGSVIVVPMIDVTKITKEKKVAEASSAPKANPAPAPKAAQPRMNRAALDSGKVYRWQKPRGYMFRAEVIRVGLGMVGMRIVNGYKIHRLGQLGVGLGWEVLFNMPTFFSSNNSRNDWNSGHSDGFYIPLFLHYQGDILKKRHTPYYLIEMGYAFHPSMNGPFGVFDYDNGGYNTEEHHGGGMLTVGFGGKFNTRKGPNLQVGATLNFRTNKYRVTETYYDEFGNPFSTVDEGRDYMIIPSVGFAVGF